MKATVHTTLEDIKKTAESAAKLGETLNMLRAASEETGRTLSRLALPLMQAAASVNAGAQRSRIKLESPWMVYPNPRKNTRSAGTLQELMIHVAEAIKPIGEKAKSVFSAAANAKIKPQAVAAELYRGAATLGKALLEDFGLHKPRARRVAGLYEPQRAREKIVQSHLAKVGGGGFYIRIGSGSHATNGRQSDKEAPKQTKLLEAIKDALTNSPETKKLLAILS